MLRVRVGDFDIRHTVESAQPLTFFADIKGGGKGIAYPYGSSLIEVEQHGNGLRCASYGPISEQRLMQEVVTRLGIRDDISRIYRAIDTDAAMHRAIARYRGLRITKNNLWETTLCFLVSQFNNVKRIRGIVRGLVGTYGTQRSVSAGGIELAFRTFPGPEAIAEQSEKQLMAHGAGYRAAYIKETARECSESFELGRLYAKGYDEAKSELMTLPGVGDKVADCILLFGYNKLEAFPVDTWIKRAVEREYFGNTRQSVRRIHEFAEERWGAYAGYAQQYLFHNARNE